ncbi:hypothetical protein [Candidatus Reidiella endopervernicosa]|nr:hypothetical protein [Candidatus Reidiella endopervernicosa]
MTGSVVGSDFDMSVEARSINNSAAAGMESLLMQERVPTGRLFW